MLHSGFEERGCDVLVEKLQHYLIGTAKKSDATTRRSSSSQKKWTCTYFTISGQWRALRGFQLTKEISFLAEFAHSARLCRKQLSKKEVFHAQTTYNGKRNKSVYVLYLWRAFEVHPRNRQSGDVHCNTPVHIECAHNEKEPPAYN